MSTTDAPAQMAKIPDVLSILNYSLSYRTAAGIVPALKKINLSIAKGETHGLVGESGSGQSSMAWSVMRYMAQNAIEHGGAIRLNGKELLEATPAELAEIRGHRISMVFQDPSTSLNPTMRIGEQIIEVLNAHRGLSKIEAREAAEAALARTGIHRPADMLKRYPHEVSGGEKQRVVIATAFSCEPELIIFDEPTTALDVLTGRKILDLFNELREETQVSALYISHDLALVSRIADTVSVLKKGEIVERGKIDEVFSNPQHTYTRELIGAVPHPGRWIGVPAPEDKTPLLSANGISVRYSEPSIFEKLFRKTKPTAKADDNGRSADGIFWGARDVSIDVRPGELLGIVGESGSGKSTMAKVISGLQDFEGSVTFAGQSVQGRKDIGQDYRRRVQIIFQHPDASLNPRQTIGRILSRPLKLYNIVPADKIAERVGDLLERVRLPREYASRLPHQLSGGEKQRVAIARAFAAEPELVICDEVTAALDVSVQKSVAELLVALQHETGTACVFITHDLNLIRQLAHRIAVMQHGRLVDFFDREDATSPERADYTRELLSAVPVQVSLEGHPA